MVQGVATLVVDLGNSSTKAMVLFGKNKNGTYKSKKFDIPNVFALLDEDYEVSDEYNEETSTILHIDTELNGYAICGNYCNGELQQKERPTAIIKPSATRKKYECESTPLSLRMAFYKATQAIMEMSKTVDYTKVDVTWKVVTLLPPGDIETGKDKMESIIRDVEELDIIYPELCVPINIEKVVVLPEGYCAYIANVFDRGQAIREKFAHLAEETILVFDIGAGTTDIIMVDHNKLVQDSKYSIAQGGNNVYQNVRRKLRLDLALDLKEADIQAGIIKGVVRDGTKDVQIVDIINSAKADVAQKIVSEIQNFLEMTDIKTRGIGYLITCGGGAVQDSECEGIDSLSELILRNFKLYAPNAELVEVPTETIKVTDNDGNTAEVTKSMNLREMNLYGASILAEGV